MERPFIRISYNISELLWARHMTQKELAKKAGVSYSVLSGYMRGLHDPSATRLKKIARALGCSVDELLKGVDE